MAEIVVEGSTPGVTVDGSGASVLVTVTTGGGGGGGAVDSVNGETGVVVLDAADVGADAAGTAAGLVDDLSGVTNATTARSNLGLGTAATVNTGTGATNVILGNDARLTDARTPTAHAASHQDGGADELALDGSQVTSGTVAAARLGSGTANSSTVLHGDGTWAVPSGGGGAWTEWPRTPAGKWRYAPYTGSNGQWTVSRTSFLPLYGLPEDQEWDAVGVYVVTGEAGINIHIDIYDDDDGYPGSRILAPGSVSGATSGVKVITFAATTLPSRVWTAVTAPHTGAMSLTVTSNVVTSGIGSNWISNNVPGAPESSQVSGYRVASGGDRPATAPSGMEVYRHLPMAALRAATW